LNINEFLLELFSFILLLVIIFFVEKLPLELNVVIIDSVVLDRGEATSESLLSNIVTALNTILNSHLMREVRVIHGDQQLSQARGERGRRDRAINVFVREVEVWDTAIAIAVATVAASVIGLVLVLVLLLLVRE
jgi:hypothetical protein